MTAQVKRIGTRAQVERALDAVVDQAGGEAALAAMNLTTGEEIARNAERSMPTASVFKLPLLVEVFRQAEAGALDLDERVTLRAEDVVMGSGILRDFGPGLQPTLRDLGDDGHRQRQQCYEPAARSRRRSATGQCDDA